MEPNFLGRPLDIADRDDLRSSMRHEFVKNFQDDNIHDFANPADLNFADLSKTYFPQFNSHHEDHPKVSDPETSHNARIPVPREDISAYQMNPSPYGLPHHGTAHYNPNYNTNFGFNSVKPQSFQQEHPGYPGYHHNQSYYYPNAHHYDPHGVQASHGNNIDYHHHSRDIADSFMTGDSLSKMWDNNPSKPINYKNMQMNGYHNTDHGEMKGNPGFSSYEGGNDQRLYQNIHEYDARRNHMLRTQEMQMRKGLEPQQNGLHSLFQGSQVPVNKGSVSQTKYTPKLSPKKGGQNTNLDFDDGDNDGEDGDDKGRSTRGLRVLSLKVKEIVTQKKKTSYKEVAESLTHELRQKANGRPLKEESKDEQNVKRRVYDALNVLIAAGVLRKEGKVVYCDQSMAGVGASSKRQKDDKDKILRDIEEAKKRNKAKIEHLHELVFKCLAIKNLIKNNKARLEADPENKLKPRTSSVSATRIEVIQENPSLRPKNEDVIRFPFIVLLSSSPENSMNLNMDTQQKQLAIESKKPFNIFGDIDVLLKMGLHYVTRKMFDENIPMELQKFVPKYFLAALN